MTSIDWSSISLGPRRVSSGVTAAIERLIAEGNLAPGDRLEPEREIADRLGVSRTSVRDALYELSLKGLIDRRPGRGTTILGPPPSALAMLDAFDSTHRQVFEVVELRRVVEPSVAERAAERLTESDLLQLEDIVRQSSSNLNTSASVSLDEQFHVTLAKCTRNALLSTLVNSLNEWIYDLRVSSHRTNAGRQRSIDGHQAILDAIREGDPSQAHDAMTSHILGIADHVRTLPKKNPHEQ